MNDASPAVIVIAGPNGAGKTTLAYDLVPKMLETPIFLNTDEIARGLSPLDIDLSAIQAGKLFINRMNELIEQKESFAFETTASGTTHLERLIEAKRQGYYLVLGYIFTLDVAINLHRVRKRVSQGGHNVPEKDVIRRYKRSAHNAIHKFLPLMDEAFFALSEEGQEDRLFAYKSGHGLQIYDKIVWDNLLKVADDTAG